MIDILSFTEEECVFLMQENRFQSFRGKQIFDWCQKKDVLNPSEMKNLPGDVKNFLTENCVFSKAEVITRQSSDNGNTVKFLLSFADGAMVETVLMRYIGNKARCRNTLCVSTQVGCGMSCVFCASGKNGLQRNLTAAEIIAQVRVADEYLSNIDNSKIDNIVYMGMGEPFANFNAVVKSMNILNSSRNIGKRRMTVSTCGIVPKILEFGKFQPQATLAISLHSADDKIRSILLPINKKYPLDELMSAVDEYTSLTNRRVTFEYALFKGVNDTLKDAEALAKLLKGKLAHVNLIPGNPVKESDYLPSSAESVNRFRSVLENAHIDVSLRESRGKNLDGACGQLKARYSKENY